MAPPANSDHLPLRAEDISAETIAGWFDEIIHYTGRGVPTAEQCMRLAETAQSFRSPADHVFKPKTEIPEAPGSKARREAIEKATKGLRTALKTVLRHVEELELLGWSPVVLSLRKILSLPLKTGGYQPFSVRGE